MALAVALSPATAHASESLNLIPDMNLLIGLLVAFIAIVYPLNLLLFKPIFAVLDERAERIDGARRRAQQLQQEADEVIERYRGAVRDVRVEAEQARRAALDVARGEQAGITTEARTQAEQQLGRTRQELSAAVEEARTQLRDQVEGLARQAAERIVGRELF